MSLKDNTTRSPSEDFASAEDKMRRSLGMDRARPFMAVRPQAGKERHRFRQDGEVPVVMVGARRNLPAEPDQAAGLEATLRAERQAREQAEHALQHAQAALRAAQTQLAHAEIAHRENLAAEQRAREQEQSVAREALAKLAAQVAEVREAASQASMPTRVRVQRAPQVSVKAEPKPVQWWASGWDERRP